MSEIQRAVPYEIAILQQAAAWLAECQDLDEIKQLHDKAEALRLYASKQRDGQVAERAATTIRIRAERRIGEVCRDLETKPGLRTDQPLPASARGSKLDVLTAAGISTSTAHRYESLAALPPEIFEKALAMTIRLTSHAMLREGRLLQDEAEWKEVVADVRGDPEEEAIAASARDEPGAETAEDEHDPELSDDEWFTRNCGDKARCITAPTARYKLDALLYRDVSEARARFRDAVGDALERRRPTADWSSLWSNLNRVANLAHPRDWLVCDDCGGAGSSAGGTPCKRCGAGGYLIRTKGLQP